MLSESRRAIQDEMRTAFPAAEQRVARFYAMQEYHLGWRDIDLNPADFDPGKLLRPQLALLACQAAGGDVRQALPLAAGIQLLHDFTLIHDDIEDQSETRRGRKTIWREWGLAQGINAGDGMYTIAHLAVHRLTDVGVPAPVVLDVLKRFDQTILTICEGQFLDLSFEGELHIGEDDYLAMIRGKTAVLLAAAASLGARVGGADPAAVQALWSFGLNLGMAFQIQDDVLGIWGSSKLTGKIEAADIYRRKVSLPIIHALAHGPNRANLVAIYRQDEVAEYDIPCALEVLDAAGSRVYAENMARQYAYAAIQSLQQLPIFEEPASVAAREQLRAFVDRALAGLQFPAALKKVA
jgi:geranylgeranyl diphosphate synthase, type I